MRPDKLSTLELVNLGCRKWKKEDKQVYLLPPEVLEKAHGDTALVDILGLALTKDGFIEKDGFIDDDVRGGCTAYGVKPVDDVK